MTESIQNFLNERKMEFMNAFILAGYIFLSMYGRGFIAE